MKSKVGSKTAFFIKTRKLILIIMMEGGETMKQQKEIVEKVVNYIEDNIKREISVDIIAKNVG